MPKQIDYLYLSLTKKYVIKLNKNMKREKSEFTQLKDSKPKIKKIKFIKIKIKLVKKIELFA